MIWSEFGACRSLNLTFERGKNDYFAYIALYRETAAGGFAPRTAEGVCRETAAGGFAPRTAEGDCRETAAGGYAPRIQLIPVSRAPGTYILSLIHI